MLHELTGVIARHNGDIRSISIIEEQSNEARVYFEVDLPGAPETLVSDLQRLGVVRSVTLVQSLQKIYGKRIIIVGGGAQVGQVALGFGADDMGSVMIEENVVSAAGTTHRASTEDFVKAIRALGKTPVQRDTLYRDVKVWN